MNNGPVKMTVNQQLNENHTVRLQWKLVHIQKL